MDEQEEQIRLINSHLTQTESNDANSSESNPSDVGKLVNSIEEKNNSTQVTQRVLPNRLISGHDFCNTRKLGPLVPPKPLKKSPNYPEIPQSSIVKQTCEPLYSQRLQSIEGNNYSSVEFSKQPMLVRKPKLYDSDKHSAAASAVGLKALHKITLDNPAILEQQLEALEHHKKQLEKRGKLNDDFNKTMSLNYHRPQLSSASILTDAVNIPHNVLHNNHVTYANSMHLKQISTTGDADMANNEYCKLISKPSSNIYSNFTYDKDQQNQDFEGGQPTTSNKSTTSEASGSDVFFPHSSHLITEEETQQPPSPVSSSYSELRRATEVFKTNNMPNKSNSVCDQIAVSKPIVGYEVPHDNKLFRASNDSRQFYINKQTYIANEAYSNYNVKVQAKGSTNSSDYYGYGGFSQTSSNYDSIYEPINPRPTSQMSTRSHNLMYPTCTNRGNAGASTLPECSVALGKSNSCNLSTLSNLSEGSSGGSNSPFYPNSSSGGRISNSNSQNPKEPEVDFLTDFLVKSIDTQRDHENYGICFKCNEHVVGENSGCTAMDQIYHIVCFTCSQCQINLQGKPFYVLDCTPYCEIDYLQTLEKCSVCMKPILERILRATGKPYHPQCFTCVICKKSLDGIPFTVDATNQNYCIDDFHKYITQMMTSVELLFGEKDQVQNVASIRRHLRDNFNPLELPATMKFAPRCCVCKEPIMPEPGEDETVRVVALDRSFHFECYKCEDCGLLLSSEAEGRGCYPLDDHVLCKSCNAKRVQMLTNRITTTEHKKT